MRYMSALFGRLADDSCWQRKMTINSSKAETMIREVRRVTGREPVLLSSRNIGNGEVVHTLQLTIYRLEEVTVTDLIYAVDPDATVDVVGMTAQPAAQYKAKRHNKPDLPDVSKYGNEWTE